MDVSRSSLAEYGLVGQLAIRANSIESAEASLTAQASSGLISPDVTGLGASTGQVLDLQPQLAQLAAYSTNATLASSRLDIAQSAMTSLSTLASSMATSLTELTTQTGANLTTAIQSLTQSARNDLGTLAGVVDTRSGDAYVLAGTDSTTPPISDPASITTGPMAGAVATSMLGLSTSGAAATLASIVSAVSGNTIFSPSLTGASNASIAVGAGEQATVSIPANSTLGMNPASATSTGSALSDLVAVLSAVSNLSSVSSSDPQFSSLISGLQSMLTGAQRGLSDMTSTLGVSQQQVAAAVNTNSATSDALTSQLSSLTSVDLPTVATRLSATQNQLMASYQIIADLRGMTLAAYL